MKYIVELRKNGALRGELIRATEEEARETASEWAGRGCGNTADWRQEEKLWFAVYCYGKLYSVVDDQRLDELKEAGLFEIDEGNEWDYILVRGGRFYETLSEAMHVAMKEYGIA